MSYAAKADLISRAAGLAQVADDSVFASAIAEAEAIINGRLAGWFSLPLTAGPALELAKQIAINLATATALVSPHTQGAVDDPVKTAQWFRDNAYKMLEQMLSNRSLISVGDTTQLPPSPISGSSLASSGGPGSPVLRDFDLVNKPWQPDRFEQRTPFAPPHGWGFEGRRC